MTQFDLWGVNLGNFGKVPDLHTSRGDGEGSSMDLTLIVWIVIVWAIPAAIATRFLAAAKGYDENYWTIVGLIFGPIGLWTIGLAPRGYGQPFKACVECAEAIYDEATKCPHCLTDLIVETEAEVELGDE
jgi:hypothetical protein